MGDKRNEQVEKKGSGKRLLMQLEGDKFFWHIIIIIIIFLIKYPTFLQQF